MVKLSFTKPCKKNILYKLVFKEINDLKKNLQSKNIPKELIILTLDSKDGIQKLRQIVNMLIIQLLYCGVIMVGI